MDALQRVQQFLSFARGAWTGVALPMGLDEGGEVCWRDFRNGLLDRWVGRISWADRHNMQVLRPAYSGFASKWADKYWRPVLQRAIYWYLRSNNSSAGVDGCIILTQAALEYLAWSYLVETDKSLSDRGFERLPAADRLRLLLSSLEIPLEIPHTLQTLAAACRGLGWDGPRAFTELRNDLVHPARKKRPLGPGRPPYYEVWSLGQWYVELVLLRLMDFTGVYHERVGPARWMGEVVPVPWARA
jgi:hypothetical protein